MNFDPPAIVRDHAIVQPNDPSVAAEFERRSGPRLLSVYRLAHVATANDNGLARIYNVSDTGLGLKLHIPVMLGDPVAIRLTEDLSLTGHIVWTDGSDCGVRLSDTIDGEALLRQMAAQSRLAGQRPLRMPVDKPAVARSERGLRRIDIQDVSQTGMKVEHDGSFQQGLRVKVLLPSGLERRGVVRWTRDRIAGLALLEPFSANELGSVRGF